SRSALDQAGPRRRGGVAAGRPRRSPCRTVLSGVDGTRRTGVHSPQTTVRRLSAVRRLRLAEGGPTCVYGPHQAHATLQRHRPTRAWSATRRAPWHHRSGGEGTARSRLAEGGTTRRVPGLVAQ